MIAGVPEDLSTSASADILYDRSMARHDNRRCQTVREQNQGGAGQGKRSSEGVLNASEWFSFSNEHRRRREVPLRPMSDR